LEDATKWEEEAEEEAKEMVARICAEEGTDVTEN
jgi:hypothetical protein